MLESVSAHHGRRLWNGLTAARGVAAVLGLWFLLSLPGVLKGQAGVRACDILCAGRLAEALAKQHEDSKAAALLHEVEHCADLTSMDWFHIGSLYGKLNDFDDALAAFHHVDINLPDPQTHAYVVALTQLHKGDPAAAVQTLTELSAATALDGDSLNLLAVSYSREGQYQFAYDLLRSHLRRAPEDLNAYLNLVTLLSDAGQFSQAKQIAQECVAAFPGLADPLVALGAVDTLLGGLSDAEGSFQQAAAAAPRQPEVRFLLALADYRMENFSKAEAVIHTAMTAGVINADLLYLLAECRIRLEPERPALALRELDRAIALDPKSVPARTLRGRLYLEQGRLRDARTDLELAHSLDPKMRSAAYNLARVYSSAGNQGQARALYRQMSTSAESTVAEVSAQRVRQALTDGP